MENMNATGDLFSTGVRKFTVSQKIPFPVSYAFKAGAAVETANIFNNMYLQKRWGTIRDARMAYYKYYEVNRIISIMEETVELVKQFSRIASSKYATGNATQQDVLKADVEYARLTNELITLNQKKEIAMAKLEYIMGEEGSVDKKLKIAKPAFPELRLDDEEVKGYIIQAPIVKKAESEKNKFGHLKSAAITGYIPDINLKYKKYVDSAADNYDIMFEFSIPLWFPFTNQSKVNESFEKAEAKNEAYKDVLNKAVSDAKEYYEIVKATRRLVKLYENTLIPQAENAYRSSQSAYQSGQIEFINLLDSERTLLNFKIQYYKKLTEYLVHFRMLEALLGMSLDSKVKSQDANQDKSNEKVVDKNE